MSLQLICDVSQTLFVRVRFFRVIKLVNKLGLERLKVMQIS